MDFSEIVREMRLMSMINFYKTLDPHTEYVMRACLQARTENTP